MEQVRKMNLPIVGRVQHGEQQILNQKRRVVELGYFIAKIKNDNMQFLLNRFNETYNKETKINIRFFDEEPLSVRRIRYNQGELYVIVWKTKNKANKKYQMYGNLLVVVRAVNIEFLQMENLNQCVILKEL